MKFNVRFKNKNLIDKDIFKRTQGRLTLIYSSMLMLFLLLFVVIVYFLLYTLIYNEQERELINLTNHEVNFFRQNLIENKAGSIDLDDKDLIVANDNQFFYYVVNQKNQLLMGNEVIHQLRPDFLSLVEDWNPTQYELRQEELQVTYYKYTHREKSQSTTENVKLMIAGHPIMYKNQLIGTLYVGKNITLQSQMLHWLLYTLIGLAILFLGIAFLVSRIMSKRAMIPIIHSYKRQQEFVADASHELRTPLSVILSSINALEMEDGDKTGESQFSLNILSNMKNEVKRTIKLVGDLLTLARSDTETYKPLKETFDFSPSIKKVVQSMEHIAKPKNITINLDIPKSLSVYGDKEKLEQLLYILLDNAIKYSPANESVQLIASLKKENQRNMLYIAVKDNGVGINEEDYERIFNRFYRIDKSRSRQMGGHGLGLSIAKWIVESHHGTIGVESSLGKGSTFSVEIPVS